MNERERIIDLVKRGIITTEEGLDLIEGLANKENKQTSDKDFGAEVEDLKNNAINYFNNIIDSKKKKQSSTAVDENVSLESILLEDEIERAKENIIKLEEKLNKQNEALNQVTIEGIRLDIEALNEERRLIKEMDEVDHAEEVKMIDREIKEKEEKIINLEVEQERAQHRIDELQEKLAVEITTYNERVKEFKKMAEDDNLNSDKYDYIDEDNNQSHFSDNWKKEASDRVNQTGKEVNRIIKDVVNSSKEFFNNFEWKKQEFKVPTISSETFDRQWTVEGYQPSILDFKNANGAVQIETADVEAIEIQAKVTMYGKFNKSLEEALNERMVYKVNEDQLVFQIPNKRIKADLYIKLPKITYDYISLNVLNGGIKISNVELNDLLVKVVNGGVTLDSVKAVMTEVKGSSTNNTFKNVDIQDLIINTVNGNVILQGDIIGSSVATTNGEIKATLTSDEMALFEGTTVNGDVKVSLPESRDLEVEGKTTFGRIFSRLSDTELINENDDLTDVKYARDQEGNALRVKTKTVRGNILFKDYIK